MPRVVRTSMKVRSTVVRPAAPPRGFVNDGEYALLYSGNILYDPGFELFVGNAVGSYEVEKWDDRTGTRTYTLPIYDPSCDLTQRWPNGDCVDYYDLAQWVAVDSLATYATDFDATRNPPVRGTVETGAWRVAGVWNPTVQWDTFLGTYHLVWDRWTSGPGGNPATLMILSPGIPGYSARVEGGALVTWSVRSRAWGRTQALTETWADTGDPSISVMLYFYNEAGTLLVGGGDYYNALTETYTEWSYQATAPSGAWYIRAMVAFTALTPSEFGETIDPTCLVDSGVLSIE